MLRLKQLGIDTCHETVAFLARRCPLYRAQEFVALARIEISGGGRRIIATLNIVDDESIMAADELGLSLPAYRQLGLPDGTPVEIAQASPPASLDHIRAKIDGAVLSPEAYQAIARDLAAHRYSKMEIAAFLIASARFTTAPEVLSLTRAMASVGGRLTWNGDRIVDKHCIGGIPGNRTSMIVVPIVAAHGLKIPKTSSRAITSPSGTADTMEVLARVDVGPEEMREIVAAQNGCLVWGGHANLSPADDVLISVERPLSIDTPEQMVASILSKKLAAGSTHLVLDLPVSPTAKLRHRESFVRLRKLFEYVADEVGLNTIVVGTDGTQPIGRGIGPWLEARDVLQVLERHDDAPRDLRERAILLAGHVLEFDPGLRARPTEKRGCRAECHTNHQGRTPGLEFRTVLLVGDLPKGSTCRREAGLSLAVGVAPVFRSVCRAPPPPQRGGLSISRARATYSGHRSQDCPAAARTCRQRGPLHTNVRRAGQLGARRSQGGTTLRKCRQ
ncbi:MAG: thymidine phosphorylase [Reyranella sp.]|nr:thymidine phosphorylase [Reyranella sp.]